MTEKEKAKELVEKFHKMGDIYPVTTYAHAKSCALVCVDEILSLGVLEHLTGKETKYWQQVKTEIEQL